MADGRTHGRATGIVAPLVGIVAGLATVNPLIGLLTAIGCLFGLFVDPDLDVDGLTASERRALRLVRLPGWLWVVFWYPYAKLIPHRHWLSHWPIIGTAIRVAYLLVPLSLLVFLVNPLAFSWMMWGLFWAGPWLFIGLAASDIAHWILDK